MNPGDRISGWYDGVPHEATVAGIEPPHPGCEGHYHVIVRLDDGTLRETFSDAIQTLP